MKNNYIKLNINYLVEKENKGKDGFGNLFNLNRGTIGTYINGKALPKIETLQKISEKKNFRIFVKNIFICFGYPNQHIS